jgi:hypothetical protein
MLKYQKMKVTEMYDRRMKKIESLLIQMIHRQQGGGLNRSYIATGSDLDQITEATNIKLQIKQLQNMIQDFKRRSDNDSQNIF